MYLDGNDALSAMLSTIILLVIGIFVCVCVFILLHYLYKKYKNSKYKKQIHVTLGIFGVFFFVSPTYILLSLILILSQFSKYWKYSLLGLIFIVPWNYGNIKQYTLDSQGTMHSPNFIELGINTVFPEEEVMNIAINTLRWIPKSLFPVKGYIADAFYEECKNGTIKDFTSIPNINICSGIYPQLLNYRTCYVKLPTNYDPSKKYPLLIFGHGAFGNWKLYQKVFKQFDDYIVISVGTKNLSGIYNKSDIEFILNNVITKYNYSQLHIAGLSNGGSLVNAAKKYYSNTFNSITFIACQPSSVSYSKSTINLAGGKKDGASSNQPYLCKQLEKNGTKTNLLWSDDYNHFLIINHPELIYKLITHE